MIIPELLAPAGDRERLEAALMFGADAVYLGGDAFGMRAAPQNFNFEQLEDAVKLCHEKPIFSFPFVFFPFSLYYFIKNLTYHCLYGILSSGGKQPYNAESQYIELPVRRNMQV